MSPDPRPLHRTWFLVPGDLATPTGGYHYDQRILAGLPALGWDLVHQPLDPSFPDPSPAALDHCQGVLAAIPDGARVVVDGLAYAALPGIEALARRLRLVALIHHPLAEETGLAPERAAAWRRQETKALLLASRVLVTSRATAALLVGYGVPGARIRVVEPGSDPVPVATGSGGPALNLLCVATLTPRKGHDLLLRALGPLRERAWRLTCVGSADRDPATTAHLLRLRDRLGLADRVTFTGVLDQPTLDRHYDRADLFVLASRFEGYGMVFAEALARGLPILATAAGAVPHTIPPGAGLLVPPEDPPALTQALARLIDDPSLRASLAARARAAGLRLPTWEHAARDFAAALAGRDHPESRP